MVTNWLISLLRHRRRNKKVKKLNKLWQITEAQKHRSLFVSTFFYHPSKLRRQELSLFIHILWRRQNERTIFSHVKCSFIKMRNVYSWNAKKTSFSYISFSCSTQRQLVFICVYFVFLYQVCVCWTYTITLLNQMAGETEHKAEELHDGMKGPICFLMYTFPILALLVVSAK